jgi:predicted amidohydrolase
MLPKIEVAVAQIDIPFLCPETNLKKILDLMEEIKISQKESNLIVFPESTNVGYVQNFDDTIFDDYVKKSEDLSGHFISSIRNKARKLNVHVVVGMSRLKDDKQRKDLFNSAVLIDNKGNIGGVYDKIHLFREEKKIYKPGSEIEVYDTQIGKIGLTICYDMSFPEISRILAIKGAEIVCNIFNGRNDKPYKPSRIEYLARTRAYENNTFVILSNRVGIEKETTFAGHSIITAPNGEIVSRSLSTKEEVIYGTLNQKALIEERNVNFVLKDRRPNLYGYICR